jgi:hypothetical protein
MIQRGEITDAQSIAALGLLLLHEQRENTYRQERR